MHVQQDTAQQLILKSGFLSLNLVQDMQSYFEYYGYSKDVFRILEFEETHFCFEGLAVLGAVQIKMVLPFFSFGISFWPVRCFVFSLSLSTSPLCLQKKKTQIKLQNPKKQHLKTSITTWSQHIFGRTLVCVDSFVYANSGHTWRMASGLPVWNPLIPRNFSKILWRSGDPWPPKPSLSCAFAKSTQWKLEDIE